VSYINIYPLIIKFPKGLKMACETDNWWPMNFLINWPVDIS